ncbi:MAG: hypothetical protein LDL19_00180 [Thiobacillus sp.]|nr:hypothetical protein [Thiobacillus sp.]
MIYATDPNTRRPWARKWERILAAMLDGKARNAIEHGRELATTCLHSDVSSLEARGLKFSHERITVAGYGGSKTSVVSYRLLPESFPLARRLLGLATPQNPPHGDAARAYLLQSRGGA